MIHHHIDRAISLVELHQNQVDMYQDVFEWNQENNLKVEYSDDETEYNQNTTRKECTDDDFLSYCKRELRYHQHELEKARTRMRICMLTFNKGGSSHNYPFYHWVS